MHLSYRRLSVLCRGFGCHFAIWRWLFRSYPYCRGDVTEKIEVLKTRRFRSFRSKRLPVSQLSRLTPCLGHEVDSTTNTVMNVTPPWRLILTQRLRPATGGGLEMVLKPGTPWDFCSTVSPSLSTLSLATALPLIPSAFVLRAREGHPFPCGHDSSTTTEKQDGTTNADYFSACISRVTQLTSHAVGRDSSCLSHVDSQRFVRSLVGRL